PRWRASIDLELTAELQSILDDAVFRLSDRGVENGAVVVLERARHEVLAYVGSTDYFDASRTGAIDFAATLRPSGSTLKPFVYAAALDRGLITPATILDDLFRGPGSIENADRRFLGPMLPRTALANSRNVPAAQLVHELGLGPTYDGLRALRLHNREKPATHYGLGLALGLLPVRLIDLVTAYAALADDGRYAPPRFFVDEACTDCAERVLSAASSRQVTDFLSDPLARLPTFVRMGPTEYPFGVALKTGTSQGYRDAWTVLYTERHVLGVWLGRPDAQPMRQVGGATSAAVAKVMLQKLEPEDMRGLSDLGFAPPEGHTPTAICAWSGGRATPRCDQHFVEHFAPGQAPTHDCSVHVARAVGAEVRTLVDLPPRYASWAKSRGLDVLPQRAVDTSEPSPPRVLRPVAGTRVMQDPEMPKSAGTMALLAEVEGTRDPLVWYVDGVPFAVVAYPYAARWPLETGEHTFVARVHGRSSEPVKVIVDP
ncbi:MAG: penicillin-binding transpeptidase domain-containing protein, partial [Myxococcota bacterium]